jgi:hypothetical protein
MKSFSTFLVAIVLFGLCLIEKELKKRAVDSQVAGEEPVKTKEKNPGHHRIPEAALTKLQSESGEFWSPKLHFTDLAVTDSTFIGATSSFDRAL